MIIDINPVAFQIGSISVSWYGIMVALAVVTLSLIHISEPTRPY